VSGRDRPAPALIWAAAGLGLLWLTLVGLVALFMPPMAAPVPAIARLFQALAVLLPLGLIWGAVRALHTMAALRAEADELRAVLAGLRRPAPPPRPDAPARNAPGPRRAAASAAQRDDETGPEQAALDLPPAPPVSEPLPMATLIAALNFPRDAADRDGFRALDRALADPDAARVIRAAEDVLTLFAEDAIYAEDIAVTPAPPELWRRLALGERGGAVARLAGVDDETLVAGVSDRLRDDTVFRDAAHHFLRQFDALIEGLAPRADDEVIRLLADTRSARAFVLLAQASGSFG
jgi:hypothetical protein